MALARFYLDQALTSGESVEVPAETVRHIKARRIRPGETVTVFNGRGGEFEARLETLDRRSATLTVGTHHEWDAESPLRVTLLQGICKGERMDFAVQKAVELGVAELVPVMTRHTVVRLDADRAERRREHWQRVAVSACEQCGRNTIPAVHIPTSFSDVLEGRTEGLRLLLAASGPQRLSEMLRGAAAVDLLVGPEGGLHPEEEAAAEAAGFQPVGLGPRVLRTETAGVAALAALQVLAGDLG